MTSSRNLLTPRRAAWTLACLGLLVGANAALAHNPPLPQLLCQRYYWWDIHEYAGFDVQPLEGALVADGHVTDCDGNQLTYERDEDIEWGQGGAILAYETGSAFHGIPGTDMCYAGIVGHHTGAIRAYDDVMGFGPALLVAADYARGPDGDPCGDGIIEPCDVNPPAPSTSTFPVNVVEDTANEAVYQFVTGPSGIGCNPLDRVQHAPWTPGAPTVVVMQFGPGSDGTYVVMVQADMDVPAIPLGGHIWTS